jgi:uncharacterized membrane protein YphA (DoxX/SURF4 family)
LRTAPGRLVAFRGHPWQPWVSFVVRLALAAVWAAAGWAKVGDRLASQRAVRAYDLLPEPAVVAVGTALPYVELALALLLVLGLGTRLAAGVSALLLLGFVVGIAQAWARGLRIDCGCFGGGGADPGATGLTYALEIARDGGFLLLAAWLLLLPSSALSVDAYVDGGADASATRDGALDEELDDEVDDRDRA